MASVPRVAPPFATLSATVEPLPPTTPAATPFAMVCGLTREIEPRESLVIAPLATDSNEPLPLVMPPEKR
jgi:hypothetical protein